jgi:tRNA-specific 2-thiouridylase
MKERVIVAMSGGVDSSVVAAMLYNQGYEVVGVTMQLYDYGQAMSLKQKTCCASRDIDDAASVAKKIGFRHYVLNYESIFKEQVIDKFVESYLNGYTPIPCVSCNQSVKFKDLYTFAKKLGAKFLATGHYVSKKYVNNKAELHKGFDEKKDQSYFLYSITQEQLDYCEFPLGEMTKEQTRELAFSYGLSVSTKPDSQDICFVPNGDYVSVINKYTSEGLKNGNIVDIETGNIIGSHNGIINYTVGQRRGIGLSTPEPLFVVKIDKESNTVIVGTVKHLFESHFKIRDVSLLANYQDELLNKELDIKLRSGSLSIAKGFLMYNEKDGCYNVTLTNPARAISPGQACVFYISTKLCGGGVIEKSL